MNRQFNSEGIEVIPREPAIRPAGHRNREEAGALTSTALAAWSIITGYYVGEPDGIVYSSIGWNVKAKCGVNETGGSASFRKFRKLRFIKIPPWCAAYWIRANPQISSAYYTVQCTLSELRAAMVD